MRGEITKEAGDKQVVKKLLSYHEWFWWMPPANGFGKAGIADFNAIRSGVFLAVETKFRKNKPTPMQVGYLNSVRAEDGFAFVVSERNLEWFEGWLAAFDRAVEAASKNEKPTPDDGAYMLNAIAAMTADLS